MTWGEERERLGRLNLRASTVTTIDLINHHLRFSRSLEVEDEDEDEDGGRG